MDTQELIKKIQSGRDLSLSEQARIVEILEGKNSESITSLPASMVGDAHHAIRELQRVLDMIFLTCPEISEGMKFAVKTQMNWLCAATNLSHPQ